MVELSEKDKELQCGISFCIFYDPVIIPECKHIFERSELAEHQTRSVNEKAKKAKMDDEQAVNAEDKLATCPNCRKHFKSFEPAAEMAQRVRLRLEEAPELIYEQFIPENRRQRLSTLKNLILNGKSKSAIKLIQKHQDEPYLRYAKIDEDTGQTALHLFAFCGELEGIKVLIELGTSLEQVDGEGKTALDITEDVACREYLSMPVEANNHDKKRRDLAGIKIGIEAYLQWRKDNAPGARYERLLNPGGVHWYHGPSGVVRAELLLEMTVTLEGNWSESRYKKFDKVFQRSMAESSHTEHSLKSFIERELEQIDEEMANLYEIEAGITNYLNWSRDNTQGIRGLTRFSNMYHGQSGVARAEDLLARINLVRVNNNMYSYNQFEKAYQRARTQSSGTEFSLVYFIDKELDGEEAGEKNVL